ncbi:MAG: inorganic pyrophosphatase [Bacteroidales bacterium]|nr:inorganic pyrophosphatase [Bacteroidales bacterium]MDD6772998.1 inorganic pyrophosphatase [Bacteroidales bacterium]MDO4212794.1 inorganic pyrophosphatase [Bacteroidales bacterium]
MKESELKALNHKAHPWHGISLGPNCPDEIRAFIEIVPTDTVKYEVDKKSGYLSLDRPQKFSNIVPSLYGFIPRSYCGQKVANFTNEAIARYDVTGDGDPLDVCVLTEKDVTHGDIIVKCIPIGGIRLLDHDQADDKIIAVLKNDAVYGQITDMDQLPMEISRRLVHYFTTYKDIPGDSKKRTNFISLYNAKVAKEVILASMEDYKDYVESL